MAKIKRKPPEWWTRHKKEIWDGLQQTIQKQQLEFDKKQQQELAKKQQQGFDQEKAEPDWSWLKQEKRKQRVEFAKLYQHTKSSSELMHIHQDRVSFMLTFTIASPHRIEDGDKSFHGTMRIILQQAESLAHHMRTLSKSEVFKSNVSKECAYKKRLHYEWALELQTDGNVHLHATVTLPNDVGEMIAFVELIHAMRNRHLELKTTSRDKKNQSVMPLGRTHMALLDTMKEPILKYFREKGSPHKMMRDLVDNRKENYFFPNLSPEINIYGGNGTLVEFTSIEDMLKNHKRLQKYMLSLPKGKLKLKTIMSAIHVDTTRHNMKGKFNDPKGGDISKELEDIAVFEYFKIKMYSSSQMTFPHTLYQKMRKQLINHSARYESLVEVTLDWCKGILTIEGKVPDRTINVYGDIIATEPKRPKKTKIQVDNILLEGINDYQLAKEGM